jgi:hypothetical protein
VHRARLTAIGGLLIAFAWGRPLGAQDRSVVELGASLAHFPADSLITVGPSVRWSHVRERGALTTAGSLGAIAGVGGASGFVELSGRRLGSLKGGWRGELGGELGSLFAAGRSALASSSTNGIVDARILRASGEGGVWLGGNASLARRAPDLLPGHGLGAGAWRRWRSVQLSTSIAREWDAAQLFFGPGREGYAGRVPVAYTEGTVAAQTERDNAIFSLSGTVRRDPGAEHLTELGVTFTSAFWQTPTRAFVLTLTSQLPDFVRGADAVQALSVGIRLREASPAAERARRARPIIQVVGDSSVRTVRVRAPGARRVEIMGDFSDWEPVELTLGGNLFTASVPMASGTRRVVIRIDGGAWLPAANTPAVDDDFGGQVGLLLVP